MPFLLDTNLLSELTKDAPDVKVKNWIRSQPQEELVVSALSFGEIQAGMLMMDEGRKKSRLRQWLEHMLKEQFSGRVLSVDEAIALEWGRLTAEGKRKGRSIDLVDLLLVATALVLGLTIVTRNVRHCAGWGAPTINPWTGETWA
jgi:predicted nucleic acid-binding protein